jgi:hypothetical protein
MQPLLVTDRAGLDHAAALIPDYGSYACVRRKAVRSTAVTLGTSFISLAGGRQNG